MTLKAFKVMIITAYDTTDGVRFTLTLVVVIPIGRRYSDKNCQGA
jgi:hypothetical protein